MEITVFTHDSIKGTDGYSTTTQYKCSAVSILVGTLAKCPCPISGTMFTSRKCLRASPLDRHKHESDKLEKNAL